MFFRKKIKEQFVINIPEPCSENWNKMKVVDDTHRHCASCEKTLVDFTCMSDEEIVYFFRHNKQKTCGRFTQGQLQKTFTQNQQTAQSSPWWRTVAVLTLTFFTKYSFAQQNDSVPVSDSAITQNDTTSIQSEVESDSAIVVNDTLQQDTGIRKTTEVIADEPAPEYATITFNLPVDCLPTMGICSPQVVFMGDVSLDPPPPLVTIEEIMEENARKLRSRSYQKAEGDKTDDVVALNNPHNVTHQDPNVPQPDPVPPTLPNRVWYEAILPSSLRPRRDG